MISLGIESTAHTFAIGIVDENGKIYADVRDSIKPKEGLIPRELFEHHVNVAKDLLIKALEQSKLSFEKIDLISFSQGMGIPNALRVGAAIARYLALKYNKPLIGVNHGLAHIEIGKFFAKFKDPVIVYLSGGNTQIIAFVNKRYRIFGETEDIALGNAIEELGRILKLEKKETFYAPLIEELAKRGSKLIEFPYTVKGCNMSFSGLPTFAKKLIGKEKIEDICFSFQEYAFSMIVEVTERTLAHTNKNEVLLVGGVAQNKRLQEMFEIMCKERNAKFFVVPKEYAADNGVMIAYTSFLFYKNGYYYTKENIKESKIKRNWRIDEIEFEKI